MLELFILFSIDIIYIIFFFLLFIIFLMFLFIYGKESEVFKYNYFNFFKIIFLLKIIGLLYLIYINPINIWFAFDFFIFNDYFSNFFYFFFLFFFFFYLFILIKINVDYFYYYEYIFILMLIVFFTSFLFKVNDFILLFILLEGFSLCIYILVASNYSSIKISEASIKYFILSIISSLFFLLSISIIYSIFGTLNFMKLKIFFLLNFSDVNMYIIFSILLILSSFFFKLGVVPFHIWVVEIYYGVSLSTFFFLAVYSKYIFFVILFKLIINIFFVYYFYYKYLFLICGLLSIIFGILGAFINTDIRKILAYGSITHSGFLILSFINLSFYSLFSFIFYLFSYVVLMINFFLIFFLLKSINFKFASLLDFIYIKNSSKFLSIVLFFLFLSMAGFPPFIGFFSKYFILLNLHLLNENSIFIILLILIFNIISIYIYLRFGVYLFFSQQKFRIFYIKKYKSLYYLIYIFFFFNLFGIFLSIYLYKYCYLMIFYTYICFI